MPRFRVARVAEIPDGERIVAEFHGIRVLVFNIDGEFYATGAFCPHEEIELDDASLDGCILTCWEHGYGLRVDTGECLDDDTLRLPRFPVTVDGGAIYVDL